MDLKDKLKYYSQKKTQVSPEKSHRYDEISQILGGSILEADSLPVILIKKFEKYTSFLTSHDKSILQYVRLPLLTKKHFPGQIPLKDILIFDLETTGLAGGTGTYPFLIGFGYFDDQGIQLRQYFLPDFGREIGAYLDMRKLLSNRKILLTYNGKSFDYPLLRNRLIMNRLENPLGDYKHLDLLHLARRVWKDSLPSCSLETIEEEIFLFKRWQDIDGALIPQAYFNYLHSGETDQIKRIINHNQQDIISLARLLIQFHFIENREYLHFHTSVELITMLDLAISIADMDRISPILNMLQSEHKKVPNRSVINYSQLLKRQGHWDQALDIWENFLDRGEEVLYAAEELAKYYEHHKKAHQRALDYTHRALQFIDLMIEISNDEGIVEARERFTHRLWRLNKKRIKK